MLYYYRGRHINWHLRVKRLEGYRNKTTNVYFICVLDPFKLVAL